MKKIPAYIIEEHNEAFYIWAYAYHKNMIGKNNILLHFDDHSDMTPPRANTQIIHENFKTVDQIKKFTYSELGISNFILPAIYLNLINKVFWVKVDRSLNEEFEMFLKSYVDDDRYLITGLKSKLLPKQATKSTKYYNYYKLNLSEINLNSTSQDIILDIDLDFFSCVDNPYHDKEIIVEITKDEYNEFNKNKYHFLRFITNSIEAVEDNGFFFYVINNHKYIYPSQRLVSEEMILQRLDSIKNYLQLSKIKPELITICRSRHSGFTPETQWQFIESELLKTLEGIFSLNITYINELP